MGAAGRQHVEDRFGWDRIGEQFAATISGLVRSPTAAEV